MELSVKYVEEEDIWEKMTVLAMNFMLSWWRKSPVNLTHFGAKMASPQYFPPIIVVQFLSIHINHQNAVDTTNRVRFSLKEFESDEGNVSVGTLPTKSLPRIDPSLTKL
jgi:hypothetical protein